MRDPLWWLGALVVLALVALLVLGDRQEAVPAGLERLLAYPLDRPVSFALEPGERAIRLVTWLATEPAEMVDNRGSELYAFDARATDPAGKVVHEQRVWLPTRRSWLSFEDWVRPQRLAARDMAVWDNRETELGVEGLVPDGGTLEVRPVRTPPGGQVFLVAHRRSDATDLTVIRTLREQALDERDPLAPWPFSSLPLAWQEHAARVEWDRLGALPPPEGGIPPAERLEAWFDRVPFADLATAGCPVWPGGALVWLLDGDTTFQASLSLDYGATPRPTRGRLRVRTVDGAETVSDVDGADLGPIVIHGPTEVAFALDPAADGPRWVEARTVGGPPDRALGVPPRLALDDVRQAVSPDFRAIEAWRLLPAEPLVFALDAAERARVTVRRPLTGPGRLPGLDAAPPEGESIVTLEALDEAGAAIGSWSFPFVQVPSAFERYVRGADEPSTRVSEPMSQWLTPPPGTTALRISADVGLDVSVEVARPPFGATVIQPDYALPAGVAIGYRYEPAVQKASRVRAPNEQEALAIAGRSVAIDGQVRWDWPAAPTAGGEPDAKASTTRRSLTLPGPFELIAEPDVTGSGTRVRLGESPVRVVLPTSGRLQIAWRVSSRDVGQSVTVKAGATTAVRRLAAAGGTLRVDGVGSGPVAVSIEKGDVRGLFLASGEGSPAWQVRRVWALRDLGELRLPIPAGAGSISVDAYRAGDEGVLSWAVEDLGEAPPGLSPDLLPPSGTLDQAWTGHGPALPLSWEGTPQTPLRPVTVHRSESSPPAVLVLRPEGTGRLWLRAQSTWAEAPEQAPRHARQGSEP